MLSLLVLIFSLGFLFPHSWILPAAVSTSMYTLATRKILPNNLVDRSHWKIWRSLMDFSAQTLHILWKILSKVHFIILGILWEFYENSWGIDPSSCQWHWRNSFLSCRYKHISKWKTSLTCVQCSTRILFVSEILEIVKI